MWIGKKLSSRASHPIGNTPSFTEMHVEEVYSGPAGEALKKLEDVEQDLQGGWASSALEDWESYSLGVCFKIMAQKGVKTTGEWRQVNFFDFTNRVLNRNQLVPKIVGLRPVCSPWVSHNVVLGCSSMGGFKLVATEKECSPPSAALCKG